MGTETLAAIKAESLADEAAPAPGGIVGPGGAAGGAVVDQDAIDAAEARAWAEVPAAFGSVLCMAIPSLRDAYSEANCLRWGKAMTELAKRHGWTASIVGPYLGVLFATVPMVVPTVIAVREARAARSRPSGDVVGATASSSVTAAGVTELDADHLDKSQPGKAGKSAPLPD